MVSVGKFMTKIRDICLIVAYDAGGAEILSSYVRQNNQRDYLFVLDGPAIKVFEKKIGLVIISDLQEALLKANWCLCSTSWQSDIEWRAIKQAQTLGVRIIAFIDHWINYSERFVRDNIWHLPDEIWVGDEYARQVAQKIFCNMPVSLVYNPYLKDIKQELTYLKSKEPDKCNIGNILFVSENISGHALLQYGDKSYFGYTELDAFDFLLKHLDCLELTNKSIVIRPHPSDEKDKYDDFLRQYPHDIQVSEESSLLIDILKAEIVVGCQSMALVVAFLAEKRCFSCIPINMSCHLPYEEIVDLKSCITLKSKKLRKH
jgi:hypothetical protein